MSPIATYKYNINKNDNQFGDGVCDDDGGDDDFI